MTGIGPTNLPTHIAKAYGIAPPRPAPPADANAVVGRIDPSKATPAREADAVDVRSALAAGSVSRPVEFDDLPSASSDNTPRRADAIAFYTNPAARNAAATSIESQTGRVLDIEG